MSIQLSPLPFEPNALEPHISAVTVSVHHYQHEAGYVHRVNEMIESSRFANLPLEEITESARYLRDKTLFNTAAQAWNHEFYWKSLRPGGGGCPSGEVAARIEKEFGNYDTFSKKLRDAATRIFGSGWVWLVADNARLRIVTTSNADQPDQIQTPLLAIDVWEHAYYLDYQHNRATHVSAVINHLLNWDFANLRLQASEQSMSRGQLAPKIGISHSVV